MKPAIPDELTRAHWVWPWQTRRPYNDYAHFRRDFTLQSVPRRAPFHITADQQYVLYVNGAYVTRGPARGFQRSWPFDTIDLAPWLVRGANWISVIAYNAGSSTFQYLHQDRAGLLCAAKWGRFELLSDGDWLSRIAPSYRRYTARLSMQLNFQEHVDAASDDRRWITHGRFSRKGWGKPSQVNFGSPPWHGVEPRGLPQLTADVLPYRAAVAQAAGTCGEGWRDAENLVTHWAIERQVSTPWKPAPSARVSRGMLRFTAEPTGPGGYRAYVLDLDRLGIGTWVLEARGAAGGETIDLLGCEWLDDDGGPHFANPATGVACWASMGARLQLRKGKTAWETFQAIGHRFLTVVVRDSTGPLELGLALRHGVYPMDDADRFTTDNEVLNGIYETCRSTQRVCALDAYVDTPWREQAQWWGDARVQAWNTFHLSGDPRLLERGIRQIAMQRLPNGLTYGHAPTMARNCVLPDFTLVWFLTFYDHYWQTGDPRLFVEYWSEIEKALAYFQDEAPRIKGLLAYDPRYWLFLDWTDIHKTGVPTLYNLWYVHALERLIRLAKASGQRQAMRQLKPLYEDAKTLSDQVLFDAKAGLFRDGLNDNGKPVGRYSMHSQVLAMLCGLRPKQHAHMREAVLLPYLRGEAHDGAKPSSYWITYIYQAMREAGHDRDVLTHLVEHWRRMTPYKGCTESFAIEADTGRPAKGYEWTFSHAWSAHPIFHLMGSLAGVTQASPAWERVVFRPNFLMTDSVKASYPTPQGNVTASWRLRGGSFDVRLALPRGVEAEVVLPGVKAEKATGKNRWTVTAG